VNPAKIVEGVPEHHCGRVVFPLLAEGIREAREYEKEFPDQLYAEWYRLYDIPRSERNRSSCSTLASEGKFRHHTVDQVYRPLVKSNGKILKLTRDQRENSAKRWKKLHQFLSEIGVKALRTHPGQLLGIARISRSKAQYEENFNILFGEQSGLFDGQGTTGE
jgi:hypothetical protein